MARSPQDLTDDDWYYEYPTYLLLVHRVRRGDGTYVQTDSIKIHWRRIKESLERSYKPKKRKRA